MASSESVDAVMAGIDAVYTNRTEPKKAKRGEIVAAAGISQKTFYRVLEEHPTVAQHLRTVEQVYLHRPIEDTEQETDPITRDPLRAVEELLDVVAELTSVVETQKVRIRDLENQLRKSTLHSRLQVDPDALDARRALSAAKNERDSSWKPVRPRNRS